MSMTKKIKCVRCHNNKIVPTNWQWKECKPCHDRTNRRLAKGKIPIEKIEQKAINQLINFENVWTRYKRFLRTHGMKKGMSKEEFMKDYMRNQKPKIDAIKQIIAKYDDSRCPILTHSCLEFRRLNSIRANYINTQDFADSLTAKEWNSFYNHLSCPNCNQYAILHKYDAPIEPKFNEDGVSEKEFSMALDGFFEATKPHRDQIEEMEQRQGLKEIPNELIKHLSSEYAKHEKENPTSTVAQ